MRITLAGGTVFRIELICHALDEIICGMAKKKKTTKKSVKTVLVRVTEEMAEPRFAESARKEEVANHHARTGVASHLKP